MALEARLIFQAQETGVQDQLCTWIGSNINRLNACLQDDLEACHSCFHPAARRPVQILAAPLAPEFGLGASCNIFRSPPVILVDVGQVEARDWLRVIAHEYAHAHTGSSGHGERFLNTLAHLCRGLGFEPPIGNNQRPEVLRQWPPCFSTVDPLDLWLGRHGAPVRTG